MRVARTGRGANVPTPLRSIASAETVYARSSGSTINHEKEVDAEQLLAA